MPFWSSKKKPKTPKPDAEANSNAKPGIQVSVSLHVNGHESAANSEYRKSSFNVPSSENSSSGSDRKISRDTSPRSGRNSVVTLASSKSTLDLSEIQTLQIPKPRSRPTSRAASFDCSSNEVNTSVDSGTGSLLSEDELLYLQSCRKTKSRSSGANSSTGTPNGSPHGSSHSLVERFTGWHSMSHCLEHAKQEFEHRWKECTESELESATNPDGNSTYRNSTLSDFIRHKIVGEGCYGDIVLVQHKTTRQHYAMKVCSKYLAKKRHQTDQLTYEKRIMGSITFPFVTTLQFYFEDPTNTYTLMEFIPGGDMFQHLRKQKCFPEPQSRFYAAQLVLIFEYLHHIGLLFRDLKPENILVDVDGYLKLTDFGLSKRIEHGRLWTFCGTPEYIAPEIILCKGYSKAADWWSFGIFLYEMCTGSPPFVGDTPLDIYERIVSDTKPVHYPKSFPVACKDLVRNLLQIDLTRRYGNLKNGINDVKYHKWFINTDWDAIFSKKEKPPMLPVVKPWSEDM